MQRRLVALFAAFFLPLLLAYGFYEFARSINVPALRANDPELLAFAPWSLPLAFLLSYVAGKGPQGHAWSGLFGALVGGVIGFVYFWALLITTNGMFLGFPFSVVGAWTIGASLALMLAWTPAKPVAWVLDAASVAAIFSLLRWQIGIEMQPKPVLAVLYKPGTTQEQQMKEQERLFMISSVNGKDFAPGVLRIEQAAAGPDGVHLFTIAQLDTMGVSIVFSPHASSEQREEIVRAALTSPLVARVAWAPPGQFEREYEASATEYAKSHGR